MVSNWPQTAWTRGVDQIEALGVRHSGVLDVVEAASVWTITATTNAASVLEIDIPLMFSSSVQLDSWVAMMQSAARSLAVSFSDSVLAAALLQPHLNQSLPSSLMPPLRNAARELPHDAASFRYNGLHPEGLGLLTLMRTRVGEWETEVADAPYFLAAADIEAPGLGNYCFWMREAAAESIAALESVYILAAKAIHCKAGYPGLTPGFLQMLSDAGIKRDSGALADLWGRDSAER